MKRGILSIIYFLLSIVLLAQQMGEQEMIQKMASAAREIKTVQCDFTQMRRTKLLKKEQVSQGRMSCQLPDKLRWEYTSPRASVIVLGDDAPSQQNRFAGEMARMMMRLVAGQSLTDSKAFQVTAQEMPAEYVATLVPLRKDMKRLYSKIILHFDVKQSTVTRVELYEKSGDFTVIELRDIRINGQ